MFIMLYKHHLNSECLTCRCCDSGVCVSSFIRTDWYHRSSSLLSAPPISAFPGQKTPFCGLFVLCFFVQVCFLLSLPKDNRTEQECVFICSLLCVFICSLLCVFMPEGNKQKTHLVYSITLIICVFRFKFQSVSSKVYFLRFSSTFLFPRIWIWLYPMFRSI